MPEPETARPQTLIPANISPEPQTDPKKNHQNSDAALKPAPHLRAREANLHGSARGR